jgi:hypothetical protein
MFPIHNLSGRVIAFGGRILNTHPALLPKYGGKGMYGDRVHEAVLAAGEVEDDVVALSAAGEVLPGVVDDLIGTANDLFFVLDHHDGVAALELTDLPEPRRAAPRSSRIFRVEGTPWNTVLT